MENAHIFQNRVDAGQRLADALHVYSDEEALVLAIPRGGVPVGYQIAKKMNAFFDAIIPRKIPIPDNPEAGFGALTDDGTTVLNERIVQNLGLNAQHIQQAINEVQIEIERRNRIYRNNRPSPVAEGKAVILVDDGLASGYTMLAAIESLKRKNPAKVIAAVPVASSGAADLVSTKADRLVALTIVERLPFAVADFYVEWRDLTDQEVINYLNSCI